MACRSRIGTLVSHASRHHDLRRAASAAASLTACNRAHSLSSSAALWRGAAQCGAVGTSGTGCAQRTPLRTYYYPYNASFVPEGASTSRFQSSSLPSVRERVQREYALSPLFGARVPCCVLGFNAPARDVIARKPAVRSLLALLLNCEAEDEVTLGPLVQTKEMLLHRSGTPESPRLGDEHGARPDAERRRRQRYARLPVQARTLVEVYVTEDASDEDVVAQGVYVQDCLFDPSSMSRRVSFATMNSPKGQVSGADGEAKGGEHELSTTLSASNEIGDADNDDDNDVDVKEVVAELRQLGVVYCEVPALDESGFVFDQLNGKEVDASTAELVVRRWQRRLEEQEKLHNGAA